MTDQSQPATKRRPGRAVLGLAIAMFVPVLSIVVAALWDNSVLAIDPDGPFVSALRTAQVWALFLGPVGLLVAGWAIGIRGLLAWLALILWAIPILVIAWFVGVAWIGGLAGEPF